MDYLNRCKCCLEEGRLRNMWDEYYWDGKEEIYGEMLTDCFALSWERSCYEENICELCVGRLRNALAFKEQVLATEQLLAGQVIEDKKNIPSVKESDSELEEIQENADSDEYQELEYLEYDEVEVLETPEPQNVIEQKMHDRVEVMDLQRVKIEKSWHETPGKSLNKLNTGKSRENKPNKTSYEQLSGRIKVVTNTVNAPRDLMIGETSIRKAKTEEPTPTTIMHDTNNTTDNYYIEVVTKETVTDNEEEEEEEATEQADNTKRPILRYTLNNRNYERTKHQDNLRAVLIYTNATPIRKRTDCGYMCAFCKQIFKYPKDLKQHNIKSHDNITKAKYMMECGLTTFSVKLDITGLRCNLCRKNINSLEDVLEHLKMVHKKSLHTDLKNHMIPLKFEGEGFKCCICGETFSFFKLLVQHMNFHYKNFECSLCLNYFMTKRGLKCHNRRHASGVFPCMFCSRVFDAKIKKAHHERTVHQHDRYVINCGFCGLKFKSGPAKWKHLQDLHGVQQPTFKCNECEKTFIRRKSLKRHVESSHLAIRRYQCAECGKEFYEKRTLEDHMVSHSKAKDYECEVCHRRYGVKRTLVQHRKLHYEEPRYQCERCGHGCMQKNSFRLHMLNKHKEII